MNHFYDRSNHIDRKDGPRFADEGERVKENGVWEGFFAASSSHTAPVQVSRLISRDTVSRGLYVERRRTLSTLR